MNRTLIVQTLDRLPAQVGSSDGISIAQASTIRSNYGLDQQGILHSGRQFWNLSTPALYEQSILRREGSVSKDGAFVVKTGQHTGRSPQDKFVVKEPSSEDKIWWGKVNRPLNQENYASLHGRMMAYLQGRDLFIQDCYAGADPNYRLSVRFVTEYAWHSTFLRNLFIQPSPEKLSTFVPDYTIIDLPGFRANPAIDGTRSEVVIALNVAEKLVLVGGTSYAGEMKKSVFTILNYLLPQQDVLSMHCSANVGEDGDTALFFGLSGTGKTTLSADPNRVLIGDDEHGWSDRGIFNFEGGCYAKLIKLSPTAEPEIYSTTKRFGTILENVVVDPNTGELDLDDASLTENTRGAYPIDFIDNASETGVAGQPKNVIFLTADALGVLPPIAQLTYEQAMYHFISGYTAKVAGTEKGLSNEPEAVFSACFGAPFMALHPGVYAKLLGEKIQKHNAKVWLVNTGWTGGTYGVGKRLPIAETRAMLAAILNGSLDGVPTIVDPIFGLQVPTSCPGVSDALLDPRSTWADPTAYDAQARKLAVMFVENFKQFAASVEPAVQKGSPLVG